MADAELGAKSVNGTDRPYTVRGRTYRPTLDTDYEATGLASWYGDGFHGRRTASGERFNMNAISAAHPTMPLPSYARVTSTRTGQSVIVRVNDRGPFHSNRVIDISRRTADLIGIRGAGVGEVHVEYVGRAPLNADDTDFLLASYRDASVPEPATMVADAGRVAPETPALLASADLAPARVSPVAPPADGPIAEPTLVASASTSTIPMPRPRPASGSAVVTLSAAADPAGSADTAVAGVAPVLVAATAIAPVPQPATYTVPLGATAIGFQPAIAPDTRLVWPGATPETSGRNSYTEERIDSAFAAFETIGDGVALATLAGRLEATAGEAALLP